MTPSTRTWWQWLVVALLGLITLALVIMYGITLAAVQLQAGYVGAGYGTPVTNGTVVGELPPGLSIGVEALPCAPPEETCGSDTPELMGMPTEAGTYHFMILGLTWAAYTITIEPASANPNPPVVNHSKKAKKLQ